MELSWLQRLLKKSRPLARSGCRKFSRKSFLPNLEALGEGIDPSTFHITTLADGGAGSLRAAVTQADVDSRPHHPVAAY